MSGALLIRIFITWLLFLPVPVLNGILREKWYVHTLGKLRAGQIGCLLLSFVYILYAYVSLHRVVSSFDTTTLLLIGALWLILTLLFEFSIGLMGGRSWEYMLEEYKIWEGKLWIIVLGVVFASPFIVQYLVTII
jgi:hypothetical protein